MIFTQTRKNLTFKVRAISRIKSIHKKQILA